MDFAGASKSESSQSVTAHVESYPPRKPGFEIRDSLQPNVIVQESAELGRSVRHVSTGVQAQVYRAASRRNDDAFAGRKRVCKAAEGSLAFTLEARVCRWLAATRRPLGDRHIQPESLQHLQGGNSHLRIKLVDVARDEQGDGHVDQSRSQE